MATPITMPKLGLTMKHGKVVQWRKRDGENVEKGDLLVVAMSKKVTFEIEAPASGVLRILAQAKETCGVAEPIGFILGPGELMPEGYEAREEVAAAGGRLRDAEGHRVVAASGVRASPAARRLAEELGVDIAAITRTQGEGPIKESDVEAFHLAEKAAEEPVPREVRSSPAARRLARELGVEIGQVGRLMDGPGPITERDVRRVYHECVAVSATPLAQRMAEEEGLDLSQIEGSGPGGKVTEEDVLGALEAPRAARAIPFTGMREAIADTMMESLHSTAQLTLTAKADVTQLVSLLDGLRERWDERITYTDVIVKVVALALREHPQLNSTLTEEEIVLLDDVNIGVAVALEDGLIVPVVRAADRKSIRAIHRELRELAQHARAGTLSVDEVTGGSFTLSSLGAYRVNGFTPILNQPQVGILGVGRIAREPGLLGDQVVPRSKVMLSLTIDHRVVDGAPGAAFLQTVVELLEQPALIFAAGGDSGSAVARS